MNEREWDKRLHIKTIGREDESNPDYSPYEPTPYSVLERLAICYYPSEAYLQCLAATPELKRLDDIDCNDLFSSRSARERIVIYRY